MEMKGIGTLTITYRKVFLEIKRKAKKICKTKCKKVYNE